MENKIHSSNNLLHMRWYANYWLIPKHSDLWSVHEVNSRLAFRYINLWFKIRLRQSENTPTYLLYGMRQHAALPDPCLSRTWYGCVQRAVIGWRSASHTLVTSQQSNTCRESQTYRTPTLAWTDLYTGTIRRPSLCSWAPQSSNIEFLFFCKKWLLKCTKLNTHSKHTSRLE